MREVPISSGVLAFPPVVARPLVFGNGLDYFALIINGSSSLVVTRRDKDATWRTLGTLCRERDWSQPRALYELQNGLPYRTIPPGYKVDWHASDVQRSLDVQASTVALMLGVFGGGGIGFNRPVVGIEVLPPMDASAPPTASAPLTPVKRQCKPPAPVKRWRKPPPQKDIKDALSTILKTSPTKSGENLETALCERLGEGMTRERARNAIRRYAPDTVKSRGRPRKKNSPK
jgi:hypothetical protein